MSTTNGTPAVVPSGSRRPVEISDPLGRQYSRQYLKTSYLLYRSGLIRVGPLDPLVILTYDALRTHIWRGTKNCSLTRLSNSGKVVARVREIDLGAELNVDEKTVRRKLRVLQDLGVLKVLKTTELTNTYWLGSWITREVKGGGEKRVADLFFDQFLARLCLHLKTLHDADPNAYTVEARRVTIEGFIKAEVGGASAEPAQAIPVARDAPAAQVYGELEQYWAELMREKFKIADVARWRVQEYADLASIFEAANGNRETVRLLLRYVVQHWDDVRAQYISDGKGSPDLRFIARFSQTLVTEVQVVMPYLEVKEEVFAYCARTDSINLPADLESRYQAAQKAVEVLRASKKTAKTR